MVSIAEALHRGTVLGSDSFLSKAQGQGSWFPQYMATQVQVKCGRGRGRKAGVSAPFGGQSRRSPFPQAARQPLTASEHVVLTMTETQAFHSLFLLKMNGIVCLCDLG